jgi:hypothetical protein
MSVTDEGMGFNWHKVKQKTDNSIIDVKNKVADKGRGLGFMMTKMASDYLYFNEKGNKITFIKLK